MKRIKSCQKGEIPSFWHAHLLSVPPHGLTCFLASTGTCVAKAVGIELNFAAEVSLPAPPRLSCNQSVYHIYLFQHPPPSRTIAEVYKAATYPTNTHHADLYINHRNDTTPPFPSPTSRPLHLSHTRMGGVTTDDQRTRIRRSNKVRTSLHHLRRALRHRQNHRLPHHKMYLPALDICNRACFAQEVYFGG